RPDQGGARGAAARGVGVVDDADDRGAHRREAEEEGEGGRWRAGRRGLRRRLLSRRRSRRKYERAVQRWAALFFCYIADVGNGRYEAAVATFIGLLALVVSAYTAYVQRQQVRAQVIPILQFGTSNTPHFDVSIDNKGVGPALIKHVVVTLDGEAFTTWH